MTIVGCWCKRMAKQPDKQTDTHPHKTSTVTIVHAYRGLMIITYMRLLILSKKNEVLALQLNESGLEFMIVTAIDGVADKNIITPV